jgi:hypothetical protein
MFTREREGHRKVREQEANNNACPCFGHVRSSTAVRI